MPRPPVRTLVLVLGAVLVGLLLMWPYGPVHAAPAGPGSRWQAPLPGPLVVTRAFRPPPSPYAAGHRGVDLAAPTGSQVRAAGTGVIRFAAVLAGRGVVVVDSGTIRTTYEPVRAAVPVGRRVRAGEVIGTLMPGHPGCPAAACLHWGALLSGGRQGEVYLNPLDLLPQAHPRLLPYLTAVPGGTWADDWPGTPGPGAGPGAGTGMGTDAGAGAGRGTSPGEVWRAVTGLSAPAALHGGALAVAVVGTALRRRSSKRGTALWGRRAPPLL